MHKPSITLFPLILFLTISIPIEVNGHRAKLVGGRTEINDVKSNKEVQELGRFAVHEYNIQMGARSIASYRDEPNGPLVFVKVVEAQKQVVAGLKYYLMVEAVNRGDGLSRTFQAVVVVKPWLKSKQLLNFGPTPK